MSIGALEVHRLENFVLRNVPTTTALVCCSLLITDIANQIVSHTHQWQPICTADGTNKRRIAQNRLDSIVKTARIFSQVLGDLSKTLRNILLVLFIEVSCHGLLLVFV
jgi:ABC-type transporter MlaC component